VSILDEVDTLGAIAKKLGIKPARLSNYASRYVDFPKPVAKYGRAKVYVIAHVEVWFWRFNNKQAGITHVMNERINK